MSEKLYNIDVEQLRRGDSRAYKVISDHLMCCYLPSQFRTQFNWHDRKNITNEAILRLWKNLSAVDDVRSYVEAIARNLAIEQLEKRKKRGEVPLEVYFSDGEQGKSTADALAEWSEYDSATIEEMLEMVDWAIKKLPNCKQKWISEYLHYMKVEDSPKDHVYAASIGLTAPCFAVKKGRIRAEILRLIKERPSHDGS